MIRDTTRCDWCAEEFGLKAIYNLPVNSVELGYLYVCGDCYARKEREFYSYPALHALEGDPRTRIEQIASFINTELQVRHIREFYAYRQTLIDRYVH